jgi:hypothetical protein
MRGRQRIVEPPAAPVATFEKAPASPPGISLYAHNQDVDAVATPDKVW